MKRIFFLFLTLIAAAQGQTPLPPYTPPGFHDFDVGWILGLQDFKYYRFSLTEKDIADSPVWAESADAPPLAPREAIKFAQARLDEITKPMAWKFSFVELKPIDQKGHWAYMVTFRRIDPPDVLQRDHNAPDVVPVLMNGYVPKPKLVAIYTDSHPRPNPAPPSMLQFQVDPPPSQPSLKFPPRPVGQ